MAQKVLEHNLAVFADLTPGDLVEFERSRYYSHWAIYQGDGKVIHLASVGVSTQLTSGSVFNICGKKFNKAEVCVDDFWKVVGNSKACKNNSLDRSLTPFSPERILEIARGKIGKISYNIIWSNCEHFAKFCRYGKEKSEQVERAVIEVVTYCLVFLGYTAWGMIRFLRK